MSEKNNKKKQNNAGFYMALCCCVAAIGIVGFINSARPDSLQLNNDSEITDTEPTFLPTLPPVETADDTLPVSSDVVVELPKSEPNKTEDMEKAEVEVIEFGENEDFYEGEVVESISIIEQPDFLMPAEGEISCGFSGDTLYYDSVMGDFRTHNGIDITAPADSEVVVSLDGTIEDIYEDTLGKTVLIKHDNGFFTKYSNLDDTSNLKVGMELKKGDFLAHVGTYAFGENTTEPHLHFEIICNDEFVNPEDYLE